MPTPEPRGSVLLDTHVVLWWQANSDRLSKPAATAIEQAPRILVSPITFWEVAMLVDRGRIGLDRPTAEWVNDFLSNDRVEIAEFTPAIAVAAGEMPGFHGDPADRLIVASAQAHAVPLVSKDDKIHGYAIATRMITMIW
jgi:PIN domain nuclease of toxin-antitoxin system